ncbi:MAG: heavy-metal-associated domain-containing protein [Cyanobacteria bacterium]|nr:heavy-metal-associated domain-containing protein [Cyanobacteriota bacterium]
MDQKVFEQAKSDDSSTAASRYARLGWRDSRFIFACLIASGLISANFLPLSPLAVNAEEKGADSSKESKQRYTRMDFRVDGASCVACIRRVAQRLKNGKGVVQADISIYRPHWSVVIFETGKTDTKKVVELVRKEKKVEVVGLETQYLSTIPPVVIPRTRELRADEK